MRGKRKGGKGGERERRGEGGESERGGLFFLDVFTRNEEKKNKLS